MKIGDKVYYDKGIDKLDIGEGTIKDIFKVDDRTRLIVDNCVERGITSCVCNGVLGYTFFLTPEDLRKHFGRTERKRRNLDLVRKSTLVYYLNRKFPNLLTNDIMNYIFDLPNHDTEMYGELCKEKHNEEDQNIYVCSKCGQKLAGELIHANYCPNCGANLFNSTNQT